MEMSSNIDGRSAAASEGHIDQEDSTSCAGEYASSAPEHTALQNMAGAFLQEDLHLVASVANKQTRHQLAHDNAAASSGAVLTVLGGKASCRRKFVLSLHLQDAQGRLVPRDLPIVASVAFAHDHMPVRSPDSGEPPLFTTFNGVEFSAHDNPTRMLAGRATFKLALSLLSSKYENRLFCICFTPQTQPPLCPPCFSPPIRSISRKRTSFSSSSPAPAHLFIQDGAATALHLSRPSYQWHAVGCRFPLSPDQSSTANHNECSIRTHASCCIKGGAAAPAAEHAVALEEAPHLQCINTNASRSDEAFTIKSLSPGALGEAEKMHGDQYLPSFCNKQHSENHAGGPYSEQNIMAQLLQINPTSTTPPPLICARNAYTVNNINRLNTPSPVDSGSPNSILTLASESCMLDHQSFNLKSHVSGFMHNCTRVQALQAAMERPLSAPSPPVSCTRPLRPQASIGGCKIPFRSTSLCTDISRTMPSFLQRAGRVEVAASGAAFDTASAGGRLEEATDQQSSRFVLGAVQHLSSAAALTTPVQQKLDSLMRSFVCSNGGAGVAGNFSSRSRPSMCRGALEDGHSEQEVEEEERAIHYLELSLYEVAMEIQKRKEELRNKRRRLLDDEARLHYNLAVFHHQPPAWLSNIMGT
ncbi:hypothetical protein L7F22_064236 [Adiantum nelumboides]|nr:hypothetical protein [Adiantum nelumboides]